jgi:hypothetical protein
MQFLALSRRLDGTTSQMLAPLAADEARVAWQLHTEGVLRSVHMCPDRPGSALVLECGSLDEAQAMLQRLPMVRDGLIAFDVSRMLPYTGWAALFRPELGA